MVEIVDDEYGDEPKEKLLIADLRKLTYAHLFNVHRDPKLGYFFELNFDIAEILPEEDISAGGIETNMYFRDSKSLLWLHQLAKNIIAIIYYEFKDPMKAYGRLISPVKMGFLHRLKLLSYSEEEEAYFLNSKIKEHLNRIF